jgi:hypothetical protein
MTELFPSFLQKIGRAEKHLIDLDAAVTDYRDRHPYRVSETIEGKRKVKRRRAVFTEYPANTDIPIIAADLIYNLRSGLDHLAADLASARRDSVMFPIFWQGVWEPQAEGENDQRVKDRQRWQTSTRNMRPEAVTILKSLQPRDEARHDDATFNAFGLINRLSNTDRHTKLPVTLGAITGIVGNYTMPDGTREEIIAPDTHGTHALKDGAEIKGIPYNAVYVNILGTPAVLISVSPDDGNIEVPDGLAQIIQAVRDRAISPLLPYVQH